jgi:[ribosomal protein S5]-alanine N-acetyltransferase
MQPSSLPLLTPRLRLRALAADDLDAIHHIYTHRLVKPWIGEHSREEITEELRFHAAHQSSHGWALWGVEDRFTGRLLGDCGLQPLELVGSEIELSYDLHPDVWGRGIASEAAKATIAVAFELTGAEEIIAVVRPDNHASRRVLENAGLTVAGEIGAYEEQLLRYAIRR